VENSLGICYTATPFAGDHDAALSDKLHHLAKLEKVLDECGWWVASACQESLRERITELRKSVQALQAMRSKANSIPH
jgi:hypothetical protein